MVWYDRKATLEVVAKVPAGERREVVKLAKTLVTETMRGCYRKATLEVVAKVPAEERGEVVELAKTLVTETMRGYCRQAILEAVAKVAGGERMRRVTRANDQLRQDFPDRNNDMEYLQRLILLLELPLNQPIPPLRGGMAAAALGGYGINVHDMGRDAATRQAFQTLKEAQSQVTEEQIKEGSRLCIQYLESLNTLNSQRALHVLRGERTAGEFFGPFLSEIGMDTNGAEVLGRLWLFIEGIADEQDQANAKASLVKALSDSIEEYNCRVCFPGKTQRLFVAILQGRLQGVIVDGRAIVPTPAEAMQIFFTSENHRLITTRAELLAAAETCCNENLHVDRVAFLEEIRRYAQAQGIT
jgi:hypothetical protein